MKKLLIVVLTVSFFSACRQTSGSGVIITSNRNTGTFSGISAGGGFDVEVKSGSPAVIVEADDNLMKYIRTDVDNGILVISIDRMSVHDAHLKVYVTAPQLNSIKASAAADIIIKDGLSGEHIDLDASSSGKIKALVDAPEISVNASSAGELNLSGKTKNFTAESSSAASINAKNLLSENTTVSVSSGASAHIHASVSLDANASSGGNITYIGNGNVKKSVSSGGSVEKE